MHEVFESYTNDPRMILAGAPPSVIGISEDVAKCYLYAKDEVLTTNWHWLHYQYTPFPPERTTMEIAEICVLAEHCVLGLGKRYVDAIAALKDRSKNEDDYQAILQVFSEMLVLDRIFQMNWAEPVEFSYEPAGQTGQRPELQVVTLEKRYFFEVKAPSLLNHARVRQARSWQIPGRMIPPESIERLSAGEPVVLPRDNPIKDFLDSAERKFSDFERVEGANILVIVWDDFIYEPITALANERSGLLTNNTFHRNEHNDPVRHSAIDAVVVVRHLTYFYEALAERPLPDRIGAFDFGGPADLPNVFFPTDWGRDVPDFIYDGLRALRVEDDRVANCAEYKPIEIVMWLGGD